MERVFLDANVLFSAAYRDAAGLQQLWQLPDVQLLASTFAIDEARRNLSTGEQLARLDQLLVAVEIVSEGFVDTAVGGEIQLPEKDRPILLAAIQGEATRLLTGDKQHFGPYFGQTIAGVVIQPPAQFLAEVTNPPGTP